MEKSNKYHDPFKEMAVLMLLGIAAFILMLTMSACTAIDKLAYSETKAVKQVAKAGYYYPEITLAYCNDKYPFIPSIEYVKGDTIYAYDTVTVDCDTVQGKVVNSVVTKIVKVPCPPSTHSVDTVFKTVEDAKKVEAAEAKILTLTADKAKAEQRSETYKTVAIWASVIALVMVVWKVMNFTGWIKI